MGVRIKTTITGMEKMLSHLAETKKKVIGAARDAAVEVVEFVKEESVSRVPVDTGALERCHVTSVTDFKSFGKIVGRVSLDDSKSPISQYCTMMHEHLVPYGSGVCNIDEDIHKKNTAGHDVGGKFLLRAVEDNREKILEIVQRSVTEKLERRLQ